jgi:hypothetical protein
MGKIMWLCKYLLGIKDAGIIYDPKWDQSIEVYADADLCSSWNEAMAPQDIRTTKSRTGYIVNFADCPIVWTSKLQTQIADRTQHHRGGVHFNVSVSKQGGDSLEIARTHKMRPRTKHINLVYHHFRSFVKKGLMVIWPINTEDQPSSDIMTKPTAPNLFLKHRKGICGF